MSVRVLGHQPDQATGRRGGRTPAPYRSRMDPDLLALALSQTEDIQRMRAGNPRHQAQEPEDGSPAAPEAEPAPKRKRSRSGNHNRQGRPGTAVCSKCGRPCRPGTPPVCCKCKRGEYQRRYRETHREELREVSREYRRLNPEKIRDYQRRWRENHPGHRRRKAETDERKDPE